MDNFSDLDFFHHATICICGSLDIDQVLSDCLAFFKPYMPINGIEMDIIQENLIINFASKLEPGCPQLFSKIRGKALYELSSDAMHYIQKRLHITVEIVDNPESDPVSGQAFRASGNPVVSALVLKLIVDKRLIGCVVLMAKGYGQYNRKHARLLDLLHDPFAIAMSNALKHREVNRLKDLLADDNRFLNQEISHMVGDEIIGQNNGLKEVMAMVRQVAPLESNILLQGETGVGKEVIANTIHYSSARAKGPFIKVNCGAIPESLIDSELFGHEKGLLPERTLQNAGDLSGLKKGQFFWMRWESFPTRPRSDSSGSFRAGKSSGLAEPVLSLWIFASLPPPTATSGKW